MKDKKNDTIVYEGLGFPIRLINVPLRKVFGEWAIDINFNHLQITVLHVLAYKPSTLSGTELKFIRHYLKMSTHSFSKLFGVTHSAILKWENEESRMSLGTEICIRLYILNQLKVTDKEFRKLYLNLNPETISRHGDEYIPLEIDAEKIAC